MFMILYFVLKHILVSSNYYLLVNIGMLLYVVFKNILKIKYVEYDNANLYVNHHDYQVQIPFEEVKEVKLMSLDGIYKFILFKKGQLGKEILCKPSLWYPFNFNKVDYELHKIRGLIYKRNHEYYKQIGQENNTQLSGMNL